jgi:hypothetical protein
MLEEFLFGDLFFEENIENIENDGFYYVNVESNLSIPLLPYKSNLKSIFSNGRFFDLYSGEMLLKLKENNETILKIYYKICAKTCAKVFKQFAEYFINLRRQNSLGNLLGKLIIVSFYGRLGMKSLNSKTKLSTHQLDTFQRLNGKFISETKISSNLYLIDELVSNIKNKNSNYQRSNVFYTALITSKAQLKLYSNFSIFREKNYRLLYVDTDLYFIASKTSLFNQYFNNIYRDSSKSDVF